MLLYMCFIESCDETRGHMDVVSELDDGKFLKVKFVITSHSEFKLKKISEIETI